MKETTAKTPGSRRKIVFGVRVQCETQALYLCSTLWFANLYVQAPPSLPSGLCGDDGGLSFLLNHGGGNKPLSPLSLFSLPPAVTVGSQPCDVRCV